MSEVMVKIVKYRNFVVISCRYLFEARLVAGKHDEEEARDVANYVNSRLHN